MDRDWMYKRLDGKLLSTIFVQKVDEFIEFARSNAELQSGGKLKCPCAKCRNVPFLDVEEIKVHLYRKGFRPNYYQWIFHGKGREEFNNPSVDSTASIPISNPIRNMVLDAFGPNDVGEGLENVEEDPHREAKTSFNMLKDAEKPLYEGCNMSLLSMAARITNIKCEYNIPHRAIDNLTSLIKDMLPDGNVMTDTSERTRKLLDGLELPHKKIDVCPNGCMLFWKEHLDANQCVICKAHRFKKTLASGKRVAYKELIYFPITPRLQRLYATKSTAESMRWHAKYPRQSGYMSHPSDGEAWKHVDRLYPSFAADPRNVRLGLSTDGFSPFSKSGKQYSCWPVILTPYNLPPWLCMKKPFMFLSLLVPGPTNPKGNLDVYLQPLIEELINLWEVGAPTYDVSKKQNFQMKAVLLWTISDFPAYGMLSGWSTCGKLSCPYCMEKTKAFTLKHGTKQTWFDCHRQFLPDDHAFRQNKSGFYKDRVESATPPPRLSGDELWKRVSKLPTCFDHVNMAQPILGYGVDHNWTKQSVFWQLPYWSKLLIRHNLDVMHIEKNFFDNLFNTIMDVKGKSKDNIKARKDLHLYCKRRKLEVQDVDVNGAKKTKMPIASYVLSKEKRKALCDSVKKLKFPDGYASNLGRCVDNKECKLFGMKSHDCHVFMERLLPIAFRELLPLSVWKVVTEISQFFKDLCSSTLRIEDMIRLEKNIPEIICKLEKIFPPSFFNVMEHLPVHLPYEARVGGPIQYRWMYPYERFLYHLKKKVGNKSRVESSICNAYLTEEISNFCIHYFESDVDTKGKSILDRFDIGSNVQLDPKLPELFQVRSGYATYGGDKTLLEENDYDLAHAYVLSNCGIVFDYESLFEHEMIRAHKRLKVDEVWSKCGHNFPNWFKDYVCRSNIKDEAVKTLAIGPLRHVKKFKHYYSNGFHFHTFDYGKDMSTMNYGVSVKGVQGHHYYGILREIMELTYVGDGKPYTTVLFKCDWFDSYQGVRIQKPYQLVDVNHMKKYPKYDPFVLAYQVEQVCFTTYPSLNASEWWAVTKVSVRGSIEVPADLEAFQTDLNQESPSIAEFDAEDEEDIDIIDEILVEENEEGAESGSGTETDDNLSESEDDED